MAGADLSNTASLAMGLLRWSLVLAALVVIADVLARPRSHFVGGPVRGRLVWLVPQVLFLLVAAAGYVGPEVTLADRMTLASVPLLALVDVAYLLLVVSPRSPRACKRGGAHAVGANAAARSATAAFGNPEALASEE